MTEHIAPSSLVGRAMGLYVGSLLEQLSVYLITLVLAVGAALIGDLYLKVPEATMVIGLVPLTLALMCVVPLGCAFVQRRLSSESAQSDMLRAIERLHPKFAQTTTQWTSEYIDRRRLEETEVAGARHLRLYPELDKGSAELVETLRNLRERHKINQHILERLASEEIREEGFRSLVVSLISIFSAYEHDLLDSLLQNIAIPKEKLALAFSIIVKHSDDLQMKVVDKILYETHQQAKQSEQLQETHDSASIIELLSEMKQTLSDRDIEILKLYYDSEMTVRDIAELLSINENIVKVEIARIRAKIRRRLEAERRTTP